MKSVAPKILQTQKIEILIAIYIFCIVVAETLGVKTFPLIKIFGYQFNASVAIFVLPLIFTINDVITEVFGKDRARSLARNGMLVVAMTLGFAALATALPASTRFLATEKAYDTIFGQSIRIAAASLTAFSLAELLDIWVFATLRAKFGVGKLWLRNNLSNFLSQLVDTSVFMTLAFYSFDKSWNFNAGFLISLILPYWLLKCSASVLETPFVYWGVKWLRSDKS